ncbi:MAG TPA: GNAT family N-acetyltransferase [Kofleriaceae bacterium]|nr:GNAT family N-acetyltransferase [Kofleriaceae bacterium]
MFVDIATALRIEHAEASMMRDMVNALVGTSRAPAAFVRDLGMGTATYVRASSPLNKVIGAGIDAPIDAALLGATERAFDSKGEPVRVELSTLADPQTYPLLAERGYRLLGFENVLARSLVGVGPTPVANVRIETVTASVLSEFRDTTIEAAAHPDDTGVVLDTFSRDVIATAVDDSLGSHGFTRYLAYRDGAIAGAASMTMHGDVAVLAGSGTLVAHRRRGVQAALLATRLADACAAGATLAVITTAAGTQSQANVMKLGFALAYARAVLVRAPRPAA